MPVHGLATSPTPPVAIAGRHPADVARRRRGKAPMTAFVLGGGGNRGAGQIGMLRALAERGIEADLVVGTSVGAINAAGYVGRPTMEGVAFAADIWRHLRTQDVFPRSRLHGSWRFVERRDSVFALDGLRAVVDGFLRFDRLEDAPLPLAVVACTIADGVEHWFTAGPALQIILASAALPAVFPPVEIGGSLFVDGGVVDNVPLSVALAAGARRIFVLLCGEVDRPLPVARRPLEALLSAFDLALMGRLRRDLAAVPEEVEVIVFEQPGTQQIDWQDFSHTDVLIEQGYHVARDVLDRYSERLASGEPSDKVRRWPPRTSTSSS